MVFGRVYELLPEQNSLAHQRLGSWRVRNRNCDGGEQVVKQRSDGGVTDRTGLKILHPVFLGQADGICLLNGVF